MCACDRCARSTGDFYWHNGTSVRVCVWPVSNSVGPAYDAVYVSTTDSTGAVGVALGVPIVWTTSVAVLSS
jgi:hypothetical protein